MYFNVSQLMREPSGSYRTYEVDEESSLGGHGKARRVSGVVDMLRTDRGIWVSAVLDTEAVCTCGRCLEEYTQPLHITIEEEFVPLTDPVTVNRPSGLNDDRDSLMIDQDHILDLTEAARQYSVLNLPMKRVCRDDCMGICLTCGADLNEAICQCDETASDSRMSALLEMFLTNDSTEVLRR